MEHKFDSFFKDFSLNHDVKTTDCKEPISEIEEADYKFAREDLDQLSEAVSLDPLSVYTVNQKRRKRLVLFLQLSTLLRVLPFGKGST